MTPVGGQSQHTGRDFENNERVARDMGDGDWTILANGDWPSKDAVIAACSGSKNVIACDGAPGDVQQYRCCTNGRGR